MPDLQNEIKDADASFFEEIVVGEKLAHFQARQIA